MESQHNSQLASSFNADALTLYALLQKSEVRFYSGNLPCSIQNKVNNNDKYLRNPVNKKNYLIKKFIHKICTCNYQTFAKLNSNLFNKLILEKKKMSLLDIVRHYHVQDDFIDLKEKLDIVFQKNNLTSVEEKIQALLKFDPVIVSLDKFIQNSLEPEKIYNLTIKTNIKNVIIDLAFYHDQFCNQKTMDYLIKLGEAHANRYFSEPYLDKYYKVLEKIIKNNPSITFEIETLKGLFRKTAKSWDVNSQFKMNSLLWEDYSWGWNLLDRPSLGSSSIGHRQETNLVDEEKVTKCLLRSISLEQIKELENTVESKKEFLNQIYIQKQQMILQTTILHNQTQSQKIQNQMSKKLRLL